MPCEPDDRIDDGPGGLDDVLAREERRVTRHRVAEQPLVVAEAVAVLVLLLSLVDDGEFDGASSHAFARTFGARADGNHDLRAEAEAHVVAALRRRFTEHYLRRVTELDDDLCGGHLERLAGADVERHPVPPPRVDVEPQGRIRRHGRGLRHAGFVAISDELPADHLIGADRPHRSQDLGLLVADRFGNGGGRRLHREVADDLQQVILDDVANDARLLVELAAALDPELLGHGDLDVLDVVAIPHRLEKRVREAEVEDVLDGFLAEVVIDAEDAVFRKRVVQHRVQLARRLEVPAEWLLDDDACLLGASGLRQQLDDGGEHAWRNGQVMRRAFRAVERGVQSIVGLGIGILTVDVAQAFREDGEGLVVESAVFGDAGPGALD